jgi:hypothetical protein
MTNHQYTLARPRSSGDLSVLASIGLTAALLAAVMAVALFALR